MSESEFPELKNEQNNNNSENSKILKILIQTKEIINKIVINYK